MTPELQSAIEQIRELRSRAAAGQITPVAHGDERLRAVGQGLMALAAEYGVTLKTPLHVNSHGEFSLIAVHAGSNAPGGTFSGFAEVLNAHAPRTGTTPGAVLEPANGWCYLNHLNAENMLLDQAEPAEEESDDLSFIRDFLASGRALDFALARGDITESQVVAALQRAVDGPVTKSLRFETHHRPQGDLQRCETPFGVYEIRHTAQGVQASFFSGYDVRGVLERQGCTVDQALQACHTDFNQRVSECLGNASTASPAPSEPATPAPMQQALAPAPAARRPRP